MNNEVYINELKKYEPSSKAMISAISGAEILSSISNGSNNKPVIFFISRKKFFIFQDFGKEVITEVYSLDKIKDLSIINKTRRRSTIKLNIDNNKIFLVEDVKKELANDFIEIYEKVINEFKESAENEFLKNINIIDDYTDNDLLKNIQNKSNVNTNEYPKEENEPKNNNINPIKSKRIVDDSIVSDNTTFSSQYIYSLLSKKNILLPDGKLSSIDKINSKVDEIDIISNKLSNNKPVDSEFIKDIKSALLKINEKVNLLKENIENTVSHQVSIADNKINVVAANSADSKDLVKLKINIENIRNQIEKELKDFVKNTNEKMTRISENLISDEVLDKIDARISKSKQEIVEEVNKIKLNLKEKMLFINDVADKQISITKDLKKYSNNSDNFEDEMYTVQKAWIENNKKFTLVNDRMDKMENVWKNQTASINSIISKLRERVGGNNDSNIENSSFNNEWFLDTIYNTSNKLLAVNQKGRGIYFDVEEFKSDIDKSVVQSKNQLEVTVDEKIHELKKFIINNIDEITQKNEKEIIDETISQKEFETITFKGKSYIFNGAERHGIRSGQTLSLRVDKNTPGMDTIYFSEKSKEPLYISKYDGIIFCNKKYYINLPREFSSDKKNYFRINHIEYADGVKPFRSYEISINDNLFEYKVYDEKGLLISDSNPLSLKYDLRWLTFFKE